MKKIVSLTAGLLISSTVFATAEIPFYQFKKYGVLSCSVSDGSVSLRKVSTHMGASEVIVRDSGTEKTYNIDFAKDIQFTNTKLLKKTNLGQDELGITRVLSIYVTEAKVTNPQKLTAKTFMICEKTDLSDID